MRRGPRNIAKDGPAKFLHASTFFVRTRISRFFRESDSREWPSNVHRRARWSKSNYSLDSSREYIEVLSGSLWHALVEAHERELIRFVARPGVVLETLRPTTSFGALVLYTHLCIYICSILTWLVIPDSRIDLNRRYGPLCKEEALWNCLVISVFSRRDIEAVLRRGSRYPLRPPQEVISHYRRNRRDRYTNLGLVNE